MTLLESARRTLVRTSREVPRDGPARDKGKYQPTPRQRLDATDSQFGDVRDAIQTVCGTIPTDE